MNYHISCLHYLLLWHKTQEHFQRAHWEITWTNLWREHHDAQVSTAPTSSYQTAFRLLTYERLPCVSCLQRGVWCGSDPDRSKKGFTIGLYEKMPRWQMTGGIMSGPVCDTSGICRKLRTRRGLNERLLEMLTLRGQSPASLDLSPHTHVERGPGYPNKVSTCSRRDANWTGNLIRTKCRHANRITQWKRLNGETVPPFNTQPWVTVLMESFRFEMIQLKT